MDIFRNRPLTIATKHGKEHVLAPLLQRSLGVSPAISTDLDTDKFGTFSGEIERTHSAIETARLKCEAAMDIAGTDLALATEGSFGPHPELAFLPAHHEVIVLVDRRHDALFEESLLSVQTNYSSTAVHSFDELLTFAERVKFPSHALILKALDDTQIVSKKGIASQHALQEAYNELLCLHVPIQAETDMRAMHNPTRMQNIERLGTVFLQQLCTTCPSCSFPGFKVVSRLPGLPCSQCHMPTRSTRSHTLGCKACGHTKEELYPESKETEDPMYCDFCNP